MSTRYTYSEAVSHWLTGSKNMAVAWFVSHASGVSHAKARKMLRAEANRCELGLNGWYQVYD